MSMCQRIGRLLMALAGVALLASPAAAQKEPMVHKIAPSSGPPGIEVRVAGRRFTGKLEVYLGEARMKLVRSAENRIIARVPKGAQTARIRVKTEAGEDLGPEFRVTAPLPAPEISGFEPAQGPPGSEVTIRGGNFSSRLTSNIVSLGKRPVVVRYASPTELQVIVPERAKSGRFYVQVVAAGTAETPGEFMVTAATEIYDFQPRRGPPGTTVTITGAGFSQSAEDNRVFLNNLSAPVKQASVTELVVEIPRQAASGSLLVDVAGAGRASTREAHFTVQRMPTIYGFSPARAVPGKIVTLRGTNFGVNSHGVEARLGETVLPVRKAYRTWIKVVIPEEATSGRFSVKVHGAGPVWSDDVFEVIQPIAIDSFEPKAGPVGTRVTLRGKGFSTSNALNRVTLAGRQLKVVSAFSSELVVAISPGASGPLRVAVKGVGKARTVDPFVVTVPPVISSFEPRRGETGTDIEIRGKSFGTDASVVSVLLGDQPMEVRSVRDDLLEARVPAGSKTGPLTVSIPLQGTDISEGTFTVLSEKEAQEEKRARDAAREAGEAAAAGTADTDARQPAVKAKADPKKKAGAKIKPN
jgi:hypothetical protein